MSFTPLAYRPSLVIIPLLCCAVFVQAQKSTPAELTQASVDSVVHKYLRKGAWRYPLCSHEWQRYMDSAIAVLPSYAYLWQQKAMPYFKCGKHEVGLRYVDSAVALSPEKYTDYRAFMQCIFMQNYTDALHDFEAAAILHPGGYIMDHSYTFYQGLCYLQLNEWNKAQQYLQSTINTNNLPNISYLEYFYLGIVFMEKEEYNNAIAMFQESLNRYPTLSDAKYYMALCCKKIGRNNEAFVLLAQALGDSKNGYTFTETNAVYVPYPYQIKTRFIEEELSMK